MGQQNHLILINLQVCLFDEPYFTELSVKSITGVSLSRQRVHLLSLQSRDSGRRLQRPLACVRARVAHRRITNVSGARARGGRGHWQLPPPHVLPVMSCATTAASRIVRPPVCLSTCVCVCARACGRPTASRWFTCSTPPLPLPTPPRPYPSPWFHDNCSAIVLGNLCFSS